MKAKILITFTTHKGQKKLLQDLFKDKAKLVFIEDSSKELGELIAEATVLFSWNPEDEGLYDEALDFKNVQFMQLLSAGYDHVRTDAFPDHLKIAANQGAYASPMAEHTVALITALSKRLFIYHKNLAQGKFNQNESMTKKLKGSVLGVIGFGAIGQATADLMRPFGVKIWGLNTTGKTDEKTDFIGTFADLDHVLQNADILLISCPLNAETEDLINGEKLALMKDDAILVNVARGPIIVQQDLYEHLKNKPDFYAGLDVWWKEPFKDDTFELEYPFFDLPNLLGSPHNSGKVPDGIEIGTKHASKNIQRFLDDKKTEGQIH
ncbi:MAG TPA: hydroxyacid dehydrogenase [Leeuwenhoekiella sp.]|nr:hydroxyacid dehydrogenase [Leeuwenhoekiella sp.]